MSTPQFMAFYPADYLAATSHLSTTEHGAYLLLIMHYWQKGGLPTEDRQLANITRLTAPNWAKVKPVVAGFFDADWKHERIEKELRVAHEKRVTRQLSGSKGGAAKSLKMKEAALANATPELQHTRASRSLELEPEQEREGKKDSENEISEASPPRRSDAPTDPVEPPPLALVPSDEHGPGKVSSDDIATAVKIYNWCAEMGGTGWPKCEKLNDTRRKNLKARLAEAGLDGWRKAMELARHSDFLTGRKSGWVPPGIEWFVKQANFLKIIEGTYVNRSDQSKLSRTAQAAERFNDYFDREGIA